MCWQQSSSWRSPTPGLHRRRDALTPHLRRSLLTSFLSSLPSLLPIPPHLPTPFRCNLPPHFSPPLLPATSLLSCLPSLALPSTHLPHIGGRERRDWRIRLAPLPPSKHFVSSLASASPSARVSWTCRRPSARSSRRSSRRRTNYCRREVPPLFRSSPSPPSAESNSHAGQHEPSLPPPSVTPQTPPNLPTIESRPLDEWSR